MGSKAPEGAFKTMNVLARAASYDPDPAEFMGMRLLVSIGAAILTGATLLFVTRMACLTLVWQG